jgi:NAD(P)-dependent dehydrogenase (short-subunit alcohol dehydrogenase family)
VDTAFTAKPDDLIEMLHTNVVGTMLVSQAFLPYVEKSKRKVIMNMGSSVGSIGTNFRMGPSHASYAITKAALEMLVRLSIRKTLEQ